MYTIPVDHCYSNNPVGIQIETLAAQINNKQKKKEDLETKISQTCKKEREKRYAYEHGIDYTSFIGFSLTLIRPQETHFPIGFDS
ncbi:hypothetical protein OUZ56_030972 [Daphnia magna]|uniref:Uncharacterized protein n=1 Tax=Daphnia magna TaxID=35525 RepID=A0ABQ9ZSV3_9CRUS|nr:hypothetical protein OUZ56_030972 [Daphnia magna]